MDKTLREQLIGDQRLRWLDVGSGGRADDGFDLLDIFASELVEPAAGRRYFRADIVNLVERDAELLGKYDLVRMQHVLEHFTFEDGFRVLRNCADLLAPGGFLLVSVPDLEIHIQRYLGDSYDSDPGYVEYATGRIPKDAPASAFFSVFAHSLTVEPHLWCYDYAGLEYQVRRTGCFGEIRLLSTGNPLASDPFTHNRPAEDVCLLASRI